MQWCCARRWRTPLITLYVALISVRLLLCCGSDSSASASGASRVDEEAFTILFEGDSVTDGLHGTHPNVRLGQSHAYLAAGKLMRYSPKANVRFLNDAHVGNTLFDMHERLKLSLPNHKPKVVSILIGINDVWQTIGSHASFDKQRFENLYDECIHNIRSTGDDVTVMLGLPFVFNVSRLNSLPQWMATLETVHFSIRKLASKYDCPVVDFPSIFQRELAAYTTTASNDISTIWTSWSLDGIHPTAAGHHLLAEEWLSTFLSKVVPKYEALRSQFGESRFPHPYPFSVKSADPRPPPYHIRAPPMASSASILFEGDSVTDGMRDQARKWDYLYAIGQGFPFYLTGYILANFPSENSHYSINNAGVKGDTIAKVAARWERVQQTKPWITHLLVGVNDILLSYADRRVPDNSTTAATVLNTEMESAYDKLLQVAKSTNPEGTVVIGAPFVLPGKETSRIGDTNEHFQTRWNYILSATDMNIGMLKRLGQKYGFPVIDYQTVFRGIMLTTESSPHVWCVDGIHPTPAGHHIMAEQIIGVINKLYSRQVRIPET
jgi:lysophospholipase L1-like esterase